MLQLAGGAGAAKVAVVLSKDLPAYQTVLDGYAATAPFEVKKLTLEGDLQSGLQTLTALSAEGTDLLVTIGPEATHLAKTSAQIPFIYTMVIEPQSVSGVNAGGVLMQVDLADQMAWIRKLFPEAKRVGVIYNPASSLKSINRARIAAEQHQLSLAPIAINGPSEIGSALEKVRASKHEVLWSVVDSIVLQPSVMREIIAFTHENKIPFIGLSESQVKIGALAAITADFKDLGPQCAELSKKMVLDGYAGGVESPRKVCIYVNPAVQKSLGLQTWVSFSEVHLTE